ncbi:MAG: glucosamine-6-phosphate deaminase [Vicinamibacterales bacterium]
MTLEILATHDAVTARALSVVSTAVRTTAPLTLGLPTGRTPQALYAALVADRLDWSRVRTFNLDEFAGLAPGAPGSFRSFMDAHLFSRVNLPAPAIEFLRGDAGDEAGECARFDAAMRDAGGLDLLLLGLGANGHIGFNEPGPSLVAETHGVDLHEATRRANSDRFDGDWQRVPARALTMGMAAVLGARRVVLMATGAGKADAVRAMIEGPLTTACPASWLQTHPHALVLVDEAAAARLTR